MPIPLSTLDPANLAVFMLIGIFLLSIPFLAMRTRRPTLPEGDGLPRDMERLLSDINRGIMDLNAQARAGSPCLPGKHEDVGRLLAELQQRLRRLETAPFSRYEARAVRLLADAARVGITVPRS